MQTGASKFVSYRTRLLALFIAIALAVSWYYTIRQWATGIPGNGTNFWAFSAMAKKPVLQEDGSLKPIYHLETLGDWRHRVAGMIISGKLVDSCVIDGQINVTALQNVFGIYHAAWLFALFLVLIAFREDSIMLLFGCFAGLLYTLTPAASNYAYPWDMPATVFFTLAYLLWQQKRYNWMFVTILVGLPFKETVAMTALLYFFTDLPKWRKIQYFAAVVVIFLLVKIAIMGIFNGHYTIFTHQAQPGEKGLLEGGRWLNNLKQLFSLNWNHFIFVNAGTFVVSLFLPMRTREQLATKLLLVLFWCGQFYVGALNEFRIMLEALPISLLYLAEYLNQASAARQATQTAAPLKPQPKNTKHR